MPDLENTQVHYHIHSSTPITFNLSPMNPVHVLSPYLFNIHCIINLPSQPTCSKLFSSLQATWMWDCIHFSYLLFLSQAQSSLLVLVDHRCGNWWRVEIVKILHVRCSSCSPQRPGIRLSVSVLPLMCETKLFIHPVKQI